MIQAYPEAELIRNRTPVLISGGTEEDRQIFAQEAAEFLGPDVPLRIARTDAELAQELASTTGVVFVPDLIALGADGQMRLVRCLHGVEERPKLVLAVPGSLRLALERGNVRTD